MKEKQIVVSSEKTCFILGKLRIPSINRNIFIKLFACKTMNYDPLIQVPGSINYTIKLYTFYIHNKHFFL